MSLGSTSTTEAGEDITRRWHRPSPAAIAPGAAVVRAASATAPRDHGAARPSGGLGNDRIDGGDRITGDQNTGLFPVPGDLTADGGHDVLLGGPGGGFMTGDFRALGGEVPGAGGDDRIDGGPGPDSILGESAALILSGDGGNDRITGGPGDAARLIGDHFPVAGEPTGESGNDRVAGEGGDDGLFGDSVDEGGVESGDGNDPCRGGAGSIRRRRSASR